MTPLPRTIGLDQTVASALGIMHDLGVRHLPVVDSTKLVGVVSERELDLISTFKEIDPARTSIEAAMIEEPFEVAPTSSLKQVAAEMAIRKIGSSVVVDDGEVVGVFTTIDALIAMTDILGNPRS